jgi:hypothetical protein
MEVEVVFLARRRIYVVCRVSAATRDLPTPQFDVITEADIGEELRFIGLSTA